jgi:hypothetical protein
LAGAFNRFERLYTDGQVNRASLCVCGTGYPGWFLHRARFGCGCQGRLRAGLRRRSLLDGKHPQLIKSHAAAERRSMEYSSPYSQIIVQPSAAQAKGCFRFSEA